MQVFVARQPIFDRRQQVYGYELLFRAGLENVFDHADGDQASSKVITDSFLAIGIEKLTGEKKAFINFTEDLLVKEYAALFPKQLAVIELLESVVPNPSVLAACQKLKQLGYLLALDDFIFAEKLEPLLELADIVKVDFRQTTGEQRRTFAHRLAPRGIQLLAEKVETKAEFTDAVEMEYTYFQGYFFCEPEIIIGRDIPGFKLNYLHILQEIHQEELDFVRLERILKREVSLPYKLLRYINSALFGLRHRVESIRHALALLGEQRVKKWVSLIALSSLGEDKPQELVVTSIMRARFCELFAASVGLGHQSQELFLLGLFSLIDVLMDRPMAEILAELPISEEIKGALLGERNRLGAVYQSVLAYEQANWDTFSQLASTLQLDEISVPPLYDQSVAWATQISHY